MKAHDVAMMRSGLGVFDRIFAVLAGEGPRPERIMIDATHLKASHRRKPAQRGDVPRRIGRTKGGLDSKLHTVYDPAGRPIIMLLSEGQMSDRKGVRLVLEALPPARKLIADWGYDSNAFMEALQPKGIEPCIPPSRSRKLPYPYDKGLYKKRHKVENLFAKLKDWRWIATR